MFPPDHTNVNFYPLSSRPFTSLNISLNASALKSRCVPHTSCTINIYLGAYFCLKIVMYSSREGCRCSLPKNQAIPSMWKKGYYPWLWLCACTCCFCC